MAECAADCGTESAMLEKVGGSGIVRRTCACAAGYAVIAGLGLGREYGQRVLMNSDRQLRSF